MPSMEYSSSSRGLVAEARVAGEPEAARHIVAACGFLPLSVRIAASRLAVRRSWTAVRLAEQLADEARRLAELQASGLTVASVFEYCGR